jgi:allophanate hydrolase subunit 1
MQQLYCLMPLQAELREQLRNMAKTRTEVKAKCADYIADLSASNNSLQIQLDQIRTNSTKMQEIHQEQLMQQQQQHAGEKAQLQEELEALQKQHTEAISRLYSQIERDQATRAQQDEELKILRSLYASAT